MPIPYLVPAPPAPPGPLPSDPDAPPAGVAASAFTMRWFNALPDFIKVSDSAQGYPLLRFLSLLGDQADDIEAVAERVDFVPVDEGGDATLSELVDPDTADAVWLPWLAQIVGVPLPPALGVAQRRAAISSASAGWRAGTAASVANAARTALTGTRYVEVVKHATAAGAGTQWDLLLITRTDETPDVGAVLAAVEAQRAKPAGVVLHHVAYSATWAQLVAAYPTWAGRNGKTWAELALTGF